jgi:hypothetical protein
MFGWSFRERYVSLYFYISAWPAAVNKKKACPTFAGQPNIMQHHYHGQLTIVTSQR